MKYEEYKKLLWRRLSIEAKKINPAIEPGKWSNTNTYKDHILPLENDLNTPTGRMASIYKHLGFDVRKALPDLVGLHRSAHHLNSSQLLCMMFFVPLKENPAKLQEFIFRTFGIKLSPKAMCDFEYKQQNESQYIFDVEGDKEYEGTSFDFHISDGDTELFFEIKLSEKGFSKAKSDERHKEKAAQYIKLLPSAIRHDVDTAHFLKHYQIYRNIIRANKPDKYVVFITDANNPATNSDLNAISFPNNVIRKTWQEIARLYPLTLLFQLKALWYENTYLAN